MMSQQEYTMPLEQAIRQLTIPELVRLFSNNARHPAFMAAIVAQKARATQKVA